MSPNLPVGSPEVAFVLCGAKECLLGRVLASSEASGYPRAIDNWKKCRLWRDVLEEEEWCVYRYMCSRGREGPAQDRAPLCRDPMGVF